MVNSFAYTSVVLVAEVAVDVKGVDRVKTMALCGVSVKNVLLYTAI